MSRYTSVILLPYILVPVCQPNTDKYPHNWESDMRWTEIVNESAHEGWVQIQSAVPDVTGDDTQAAMDQYNATELVSQTPADPGDSFSRDIYTYMNPEKTIKVVLNPSYDPGNGGYHLVSVYKREAVEEMQEDAEVSSAGVPDKAIDQLTKQLAHLLRNGHTIETIVSELRKDGVEVRPVTQRQVEAVKSKAVVAEGALGKAKSYVLNGIGLILGFGIFATGNAVIAYTPLLTTGGAVGIACAAGGIAAMVRSLMNLSNVGKTGRRA
jgi:hypothetical protein